jgi:hypothetical protein
VLERLKAGVDAAQLEDVKAEAIAKYKHFEDAIASYLTRSDAIPRMVKTIGKAYTVHPNKLLDNLEQLSQIYDQVCDVSTITPPVSYLMQTQKGILPTYLFGEEDVQNKMREGLQDFFSHLDFTKVSEILEGATLYASWVMAKWIREKRRLSEVLDAELEIDFSSYCVLFIDRIVKVLGVAVDPELFIMLVRGPAADGYNVTFETVMSLELQFWEAVLQGLLGDEDVLSGEVPLMDSPAIEAVDEQFVLQYVMVPESARVFFDEIEIPLKKYFLAEKFATIAEAVEQIATEGFDGEELGKLGTFLNEPVA